VGDELTGDLQVGAATEALLVAAPVVGRAGAGPLQVHAVREPGAQLPHRVDRSGAVGQPRGDEALLGHGETGIGEQLGELAGQDRELARSRQRDRPDGGEAPRVQIEQPRLLGLTRLAEGVRQRGAAVAHPGRDRLGPVQMAERDVVDAVEDAGRYEVDPADADVALAVAGHAATDEGVGEHDRADPGSQEEVGAHPVHRRAQHRLVADLPVGRPAEAELVPGHLRLQVRDAVDRDLAVRVGEEDRLVEPVGLGAHVQPAGGQQLGEGAEPARGVVVAGSQHHLGARPAQSRDDAAEDRRGVCGGHRAVVDVAGHDDDVDALAGHDRCQSREHGFLLGEQVGAVQRPADVPVGGVQQPHGAEGRRPHRQNTPGAP
jgi:hypothetical protein